MPTRSALAHHPRRSFLSRSPRALGDHDPVAPSHVVEGVDETGVTPRPSSHVIRRVVGRIDNVVSVSAE